MKLIVGLGNPGEKYRQTRHNLGFMVVDALLPQLAPAQKTDWQFEKKFNSLMAKLPAVILAKPQTFINASGLAVAQISQYFKILPADIWIIHDDLDLTLGKIKIKQGGGAAGHRGVISLIQQLGTDRFTRFRLGIGHPPRNDVDDYVLSSFSQKENQEVRKMIKKAVKLIQAALKKDSPAQTLGADLDRAKS